MDKRADTELKLIRKTIDDSHFRESLESLLMSILSIDTSPEQTLENISRSEDLVFNRISGYLDSLTNLNGSRSRHPIAADIEEHPFYSKVFPFPEYRETSAEAAYAGRYNLIYVCRPVHEKRGRNVGLNAHIDVVSPYFPPTKKNMHISGRGSIDDKGNVAVILGALKVLDVLVGDGKLEFSGNILAMFVIDEEIGGNGSLSLAMDHDLQRSSYDSLLIMECAGNNIYTGNRGAVFIKINGVVSTDVIAPDISGLLEAFSFGIVGLIEEGLRIKEESRHDQFPQNPVYTCTGILGDFGKHPSAICEYIEFVCKTPVNTDISIIEEAIRNGIAKYIGIFGDKRNMSDPLTGRPKIAAHYAIRTEGTDRFVVSVFGSGGHMGSLPDNDAAITKWAFIIKELTTVKYRDSVEIELFLPGREAMTTLTFEGAQSFIPSHNMADVKSRMESAFYQAVAVYQSKKRSSEVEYLWAVTFDKLHNEAFAIDAESETVRNAITSAIETGLLSVERAPTGWDASCDARIFALEYPGLPVITTGPGDLNGAHSDKEVLYLPDLYNSILFTVRFLLEETGSEILN